MKNGQHVSINAGYWKGRTATVLYGIDQASKVVLDPLPPKDKDRPAPKEYISEVLVQTSWLAAA